MTFKTLVATVIILGVPAMSDVEEKKRKIVLVGVGCVFEYLFLFEFFLTGFASAAAQHVLGKPPLQNT